MKVQDRAEIKLTTPGSAFGLFKINKAILSGLKSLDPDWARMFTDDISRKRVKGVWEAEF